MNLLVVEVTCMCVHACALMCVCVCMCVLQDTDHCGLTNPCPLTSVTSKGGLEMGMGRGTEEREKGVSAPFSQGRNRKES